MSEEIANLETKIRLLKHDLASLRRKRSAERVREYTFKTGFGVNATMQQLFGEREELIMVHNIGPRTPAFLPWADGVNGVISHLEARAAFFLTSSDDLQMQRRFAMERGWKFKTCSSAGSPFQKDMGFEEPDGTQHPGISVYLKKDGDIYRVSSSSFENGDNFCALWDFFDMLPWPNDGWVAKASYVQKET